MKFLAPLAAGFALLVSAAPALAAAPSGGAVYTETNAATGNAVVRLDRAADGSLTPVASYRTGGRGTGAGLGSQGAVALSDDGKLVLAVDAGSNSVAAFRVGRDGHLTLADRKPSGGTTPVSIDIDRGRAFVLNAGEGANVAAFALDGSGRLRAQATRALAPGADGAAQVSVSPDHKAVVVSEKASNRLETLSLGKGGKLGAPVVTASAGATPFGFAFSPRGDVIVSEAGASTVSSYRVTGAASLRTITAALPVGPGAACWVAITADSRFAYTANGSGSISGFALGRDGSLRSITPGGLTAPAPGPNDIAIAGRFLYAVNPAAGEVTAYKILSNGRLLQQPGVTDLGAGLQGLVAR